jgi:hypothetical protein
MPNPHPRPWRRGSLFTAGKRRPLDREQRARFRFLLRAHARAGRLPAKHEWVGEALLKRLGTDGQCDPAHETLASDAGCSSRTVRRATAAMRSLGLLRWTTRLVRAGWRTEQTSNAYELVPAAERPAPRCGGQSGRETRKIDISSRAGGLIEGSDEWGRWNRDRLLALLVAK